MKKKAILSFEADNFFSEKTKGQGVCNKDLDELSSKLTNIRQKLKKAWLDGSVGYLSIPERQKDARLSVDEAKRGMQKFKTLIVLGIGGSDLGARALVRALQSGKRGMRIHFLGANTDPEEIADLLAEVDLKSSFINIISKSGDTIEPMGTFLLLRDRLIRKVGRRKHAAQIIATTDQKAGTLRTIADREGYRTLPVPDDIGGRWSVLTPVGFFPAACAGIDVNGLLRGAKQVRDQFFSATTHSNDVLKFAGLHYLNYSQQNRNITVLMPYAARLNLLGSWFRQLWAESLGKRQSRAGQVVNHGLTPIAALGATDQHSQIQLYNHGPANKMITFIEVENLRNDFVVPEPFSDLPGVSYYGGRRFSQLLHIERAATAHALTQNSKPNGTIFIPEISAESVGGLMTFFMLATSVMGELLDVNVYDQPGVEDGKKAIAALLRGEILTS
jgi:glucose-6-phosphate isomerase